MTRLATAVVAATILMLIVAAWRLLWRDSDTMPDPIVRFTVFALFDLAVTCLVVLMTPGLLTPVAVLLGVIGGVYLGRAWEQVKLARLLDALTTPDGGER